MLSFFGGRPMWKISFEKQYEKSRQITIENLTLAFLALLLSPTVLILSICKCQVLPACSHSLGSREIILIKSEWTDQRLKFTLASWLSAARQNTLMGFRVVWKATYLITAHPSVKRVARLLAIWMEPVCAFWGGTGRLEVVYSQGADLTTLKLLFLAAMPFTPLKWERWWAAWKYQALSISSAVPVENDGSGGKYSVIAGN